jgi:hypothetical protein
MDTVHRAHIDGFLDEGFGISILAHYPRSAIVWLDVKGIACDVGTVFTANAGDFIHIHGFLSQLPPQFRLCSRASFTRAQTSSEFRFSEATIVLPMGCTNRGNNRGIREMLCH